MLACSKTAGVTATASVSPSPTPSPTGSTAASCLIPAGTTWTDATKTFTCTSVADVTVAANSAVPGTLNAVGATTGTITYTCPNGVATPGVGVCTASYAMQVVITSQYENDATGPTTTEATCTIPGSTASYGAAYTCVNATGAINSTIAIPESRLYFSDLTFTVSSGSIGTQYVPICSRIVFEPYYYIANDTSDGRLNPPTLDSLPFLPPWAGAGGIGYTDCAFNFPPTDAGCYGGPAKDIVEGFPLFFSTYFAPNPSPSGLTKSYVAHSANSHLYGSNRHMVNNLALASRSTKYKYANGDAYIGTNSNYYHDYWLRCKDPNDEDLYKITFTITDQDVIGVYPNVDQALSTNNFTDWDPLERDQPPTCTIPSGATWTDTNDINTCTLTANVQIPINATTVVNATTGGTNKGVQSFACDAHGNPSVVAGTNTCYPANCIIEAGATWSNAGNTASCISATKITIPDGSSGTATTAALATETGTATYSCSAVGVATLTSSTCTP